MPPVIAAVVVGGALYGAGVITLGALVLSVGLAAAQYVLAPKPPKLRGLAAQEISSKVTIREPITTHKLVFGETRVAGGIKYIGSSGNNDYLHLIIVLAPHEVDGIDEYWIDDTSIHADALDADGNVTTGKYKDNMRIRVHLGSPNQAADTMLVNEIPEWTTNHRLRGIAYLYVRMKANQDLYPNGVPNITAIMRGRMLQDPRTGVSGFSSNIALMWFDYMTDNTYGPNSDDTEFDETNVIAAANICDEMVDTDAFPQGVSSVATGTDILSLSGERLLFERGDRVQVTSSGTLPAGISALTNYYVIPWQYKSTPRIKLASSLDNARKGVGIDITTAGSGSITVIKNGEPRYHGSGILDSATTIQENVQSILSGADASAVYAGGKWRLNVAKYVTPTVELNEGNFVGPMNVTTALSRSDRFNAIKGTYISSVNDFQPTDYPSQYNQTFIAQDQITLPRDYILPFTNRSTTSMRIALIELLKSRQEITFKVTCDLTAMQVQAGDNVNITSDRMGWASKPFEVVEWSLVNGGSDMGPSLMIEMTLRETAAAIFDWDSSMGFEIDPAPNTNFPNPYLVAPPSGVSFNSRAVTTQAGDLVFNVSLQWLLHSDGYVREGGYLELQFKKSAATEWRPSFLVPGKQTQADLLQSDVNEEYDVRIRAINSINVQSEWYTLEGVIVGSSGGVGATQDWGEYVSSPSLFQDFGDWTSPPSSSVQDWGYFS